MDRDEVIRTVWAMLEPELAAQGYELIEVEYAKQGRTPLLRLFLDKDGGITLDDCQAASHVAGLVLDASSALTERYVLEVSSPGFDRPLRRPQDFARFAGEPVKVMSHAPVGGRKRFAGTLLGLEDGMVRVECEGAIFEIHIENLKRANLDR